MTDTKALLELANGLHDKLARCHPSLERGMVWCRTCGSARKVDSAHALRHGWPKCCGYTMTIDSPEEQAAQSEGTTPTPSDDMRELLREARGYVEGNHDEGCELHWDFGEQNFDSNSFHDESDEREWPRDAICTCGTDALVRGIDAALPIITNAIKAETGHKMLWLWREGENFVAYDTPHPRFEDGDPCVLGEPAAMAVYWPATTLCSQETTDAN